MDAKIDEETKVAHHALAFETKVASPAKQMAAIFASKTQETKPVCGECRLHPVYVSKDGLIDSLCNTCSSIAGRFGRKYCQSKHSERCSQCNKKRKTNILEK